LKNSHISQQVYIFFKYFATNLVNQQSIFYTRAHGLFT